MRRSHPARQARVVVGAAGSAGFLVMVGTISQASTQILAADLSASLEIPETSQGLDLQGTAVPAPATAADAVESTPETEPTPEAEPAPETEPAPTAQPPTTDGETTTTLAEDPGAGSVDAPATTAPPATTTTTTTTTAPPQTDTTSSGS